MTPDDLTDDQLDDLATKLAPRLPTGTHGDRVITTRRQFAAAVSGVLGVSGLLALGVDEAAAQAAGSQGTESEPNNMFAYDLNVANGVTSSLPMNGNDIEDAGSVSVDKAIIGGQKADLQYQHIETIDVSGTSAEHAFSTSIGSDEILKFKYHLVLDGEGTIAFRLNQDGDSTGNYVWIGKDGTVNGGANEFVIVENSSAAENSSGEITIQNAGRAITHNGGSRDNIVELSQGGGADAGSEISHIEFIAIGASFSSSGPSSSVELMRRAIL